LFCLFGAFFRRGRGVLAIPIRGVGQPQPVDPRAMPGRKGQRRTAAHGRTGRRSRRPAGMVEHRSEIIAERCNRVRPRGLVGSTVAAAVIRNNRAIAGKATDQSVPKPAVHRKRMHQDQTRTVTGAIIS
jgi:hypothetical protein